MASRQPTRVIGTVTHIDKRRGVMMTITAGSAGTIATSGDPGPEGTRQGWSLAVDQGSVAINLPESADDGVADGLSRARGQRIAAQGTGHNAAMLGVGGGPVALGGLTRWMACRDPAGWVEGRVSVPGDDEETRRRKALFTLALILLVPFGAVWAGLYFVYSEPAASFAAMFYVVVTIAGIVLLFRFRRFALFWWTELALAFPVPVVQQLVLGGFVGSGAVILWSFLAVLLIVMFVGARGAWWWFGAFVIAVVACAVLQPYVRVQNHLPAWLVSVFFVLNVVSVCAVSLVFLNSFARDRRRLRELEVSYLNQEMTLRQADKLATLGTLAAGVAHELNNPAAAASRGAAQLRPLLEGMQSAYLELCSASSPQLTVAIERAGELIQQGSGQVVSRSPLERSDREEEMGQWLRGLGVDHPADAAQALADLGYTRAQLAELTSALPSANIPAFLAWMAGAGEAHKLLTEIGEGAGRISQIVGAMRSYTYLDQAPVQNVDITEGIESTLVLLGSKLKPGVIVHHRYAERLPRIEAHGSELNQVWTSIIENAIDAMGGRGAITLRTARCGDYVLVEIEDDGPGMPPEVAARVFDPFFTTKPPGQGTGLGLNISHNIVVHEHKGRIEVDSKPGRTAFRVFLPIAGPPDLTVRPH
jgi:signal transduction histidine kinase